MRKLFSVLVVIVFGMFLNSSVKLKEGHTGAWRGTFHGFWNNVDYIFSGVGFTKSMDFTNPQYANGFWQVSPYGKEVEDFVGGGALFNGNSITSWDNTYKFDGWYLNADFSGSALTKLPESVNDNITLYAKWIKK